MSAQVTAKQLYSYLACPHRVALDTFGNSTEKDTVSPFVQLLWERGTQFEEATIRGLETPFTDLSSVSGEQKEQRTRDALARGDALIYSGRLSADDLLGEPDLLRREAEGYVAVDIKSGAWGEDTDEATDEEGKPKKSYGVQIALYTDILSRVGVSTARYGYIWDVHGKEKRYDLDMPLGPRSPGIWDIYLETRAEVVQVLAREASTRPAAASICKQCVWRSKCLRELKESHDLTLLPELGRMKRDALVGQFPTVDALAVADIVPFVHGKKTDFPGIGARTLQKFKARAELSVASDAAPYLTREIAWPTEEVELFFDIETDPMRDVCYLHGIVIRERGSTTTERFEGIFTPDVSQESERDAFAMAMNLFRTYPDAVIVHYSKYERTEYRKLQKKYPSVATAEEIEALFAQPRALDLYFDVVKGGSEWPTLDFSIKSLAKYCGFQWRDSDPSGASSIEWFDQWVRTGSPALRQRLLEYNEDDCRAMRVVMDKMRTFPVR